MKSSNPTALVVSRLRRYKSVGTVIRAWEMVESQLPDAELLIAGTGPREAAYRSLIADLNLRNVRILGHVSPDRREELMSTSWVTLQPSLKEGWGLTVMEAARFATPSIASDVPGLRDSIVPDETGVLVPHGDPAAWSATLNGARSWAEKPAFGAIVLRGRPPVMRSRKPSAPRRHRKPSSPLATERRGPGGSAPWQQLRESKSAPPLQARERTSASFPLLPHPRSKRCRRADRAS